jgi:Sulfotransferase family
VADRCRTEVTLEPITLNADLSHLPGRGIWTWFPDGRDVVRSQADESRVKVLSLVGEGRSGSTVLAAILGEVEGFFDAGELHWVWGRSLTQQRPCGCGLPPAKCPIWSRVVEGTFGVPPEVQAIGGGGEATGDVVADEREVVARRNRLRLLRTADRAGPGWPALDRIRAVTGRLYANLVEVTDARVIVDASKRPEDAAVLAGVSSVDLYVLHIVRDPRAVVFSWSRVKPSPDGATVMQRMRPSRIARDWMESNAGAELLRRHVPADRWCRITYEDFAARPRETVRDIVAFMNEDGEAPFITDDTVALGANHTLLGNPDRFRTGPVAIAPDQRWRSQMPRLQQVGVGVATWPLMLRYGYLGWSAKSS